MSNFILAHALLSILSWPLCLAHVYFTIVTNIKILEINHILNTSSDWFELDRSGGGGNIMGSMNKINFNHSTKT